MTEKKPRKLQPPRRTVVPGRIIHVSYTSDFLNYTAHKITKEEKGEPVEDYPDYLERIDNERARRKFESMKVSNEELLRRIREIDEREPNKDTTE
jgi:hypothetical protein